MSHTVHVMKKDVETLQQQMKILMREMADLKLKVSPDSVVPSETHVGGATESSETVETLLKTDQDVLEKRLKTFEERLKAIESSLAEHGQEFQPDKSVDEKGKDGKTQLERAVIARDIIKITMLLKKGADTSIGDKYAMTPLHCAADKGFADVCALLLLVGNADVNAKYKSDNRTPLHWATGKGHVDVVEVLLKCGADVNLKSSSGKTAFDEAVELGHKEIARLLDCASNRNMFSSKLRSGT